MDGGVGEAMLISAAVGGAGGAAGTALAGGNMQDMLKGGMKGALLGGLTGGVTSGLGGVMAGAGQSAALTNAQIANEALIGTDAVGGAGAGLGADAGAGFVPNAGAPFTLSGTEYQGLPGAAPNPAIPTDAMGSLPNTSPPSSPFTSSVPIENMGNPASKGILDFGYKGISPNTFGYGPQSNMALGALGASSALTGAMGYEGNKYAPPGITPYTGILSKYNPYSAKGVQYPTKMAEGGIASLPTDGTVEQMSRENAMGGNTMFPQSGIGGLTGANTYQNATNTPMGSNVIEPTDAITDPYTGQMKFASGGPTPTAQNMLNTMSQSTANAMQNGASGGFNPIGSASNLVSGNTSGSGNQGIDLANDPNYVFDPYKGQYVRRMANGGITSLGHFSDGGQLLKGPGDGMSDDIPAQIGRHQPARLADGEFVVPADVVSHLGNGSTDAGAKHLYSMMNKVRKARTGNQKQGKQINPNKFLTA